MEFERVSQPFASLPKAIFVIPGNAPLRLRERSGF